MNKSCWQLTPSRSTESVNSEIRPSHAVKKWPWHFACEERITRIMILPSVLLFARVWESRLTTWYHGASKGDRKGGGRKPPTKLICTTVQRWRLLIRASFPASCQSYQLSTAHFAPKIASPAEYTGHDGLRAGSRNHSAFSDHSEQAVRPKMANVTPRLTYKTTVTPQ
jgi:hypothetical protein